MTSEFFSVLKQLYGSSGIPAAIADENLRVLWRNRPAETAKCLLSRDTLSFLSEKESISPGTVCVTEDDTIYRFNVMKAKCPDDGSYVYAAEHIGSDKLSLLLASPDIRAYMSYLCAKIRESTGLMAVSADEIDAVTSILGKEYSGVAERLNSINRGIMLILREVIDPEQLYYVLDPCCDDVIVYVSDEISKSASDAKKALGKTVKVVKLTEKNIFVRINRSVFETLLAEMAAECCGRDFYPEKLVFSCKKTAPDRVLISVESMGDSKKKPSNPASPEEKKGRKLYFNYMCEVLCSKYGASFTNCKTEDGWLCSIELTAIRSGISEVMTRPNFSFLPGRFSPMSLSLADCHIEDRYNTAP